MTNPYTEGEQQFLTELEALIEKHWHHVVPKPSDDAVSTDAIETLGATVLGGFTIIISTDNFADPHAEQYITRISRLGQSPFLTSGLIAEYC